MTDGRPEIEDGRQFPRRRPGTAAFYRGIAALCVAATGYLLGFLVPWAVGSTRSPGSGPYMFLPIGGLASLVLAGFAIYIGRRVLRFFENLPEPRRAFVGRLMDVDRELKRAKAGIALGVASIVANPLIGFVVLTIVRR